MQAYKGFSIKNGRLSCNRFIYEEGKTYTMPENDIKLNSKGFHACEDLYDCLNYYSWYSDGSTEFHIVECGGKIIKSKEDDSKFVCSEITIGKKVEFPFDKDKFEMYCDFSDGYGRVKKSGKWNYADRHGDLLWKENEWFDFCYRFYKDRGKINIGYDWGYIDNNGILLKDLFFNEYGDLKNEKHS